MRSEPCHRKSSAWRTTSQRVHRGALVVVACMTFAVTTVVGLSTDSWVDQPFPGFFVLPNRVIPSIGATLSSGSRDGTIFQRVVIAVDGTPVASNADAYRLVAGRPTGTAVAYTLREGLRTETVSVSSRRFSTADYWCIFGSYLATGLLYLLVGVLGAWLLPDANLGRALLLVGGTGGIFALTGAGIYAPGADLRIHALAESFFPATLIYLALLFAGAPQRYVACLSAIATWISLAIALPYQLLLFQPGPYSLFHGACETYLGLAGLGLGATVIVARACAAQSAGPLLRATVAGAVLGIGVPAVVMVLSGLSGGVLPVNIITATAFMFPLCTGYGLWREHAPRRIVRPSSSPDFLHA
jgi:hypothetical protein